ncbi:MAG: DnaJ domain-containing protein [Oceanicaulis sp.]
MSIVAGLLAVLAVLAVLGWGFARADSRQAAQALRVILGIGGLILGALLTIRGLAVAGIPIITAALGFLGVAVRGGRADGGAQGRSQGGGTAGGARRGRASMSRKEAAEILGVSEDADEAAVRAAYRKMMKQVHPDAGGSDALAARVQEARDVMLGEV